ncbi:glycosyltransferase family 4 protein [Pleomorphomonas carboxyditropha]|uniref:glycosyltransferase family 4 protein n=1 Tax=Pleomorphomonas carboxyditropha TaxID=2023338 RepID=UPI0013FD12C6|nr:glycosyltransferase family 4 protein [Pleomorphomonas carboxyditropha]
MRVLHVIPDGTLGGGNVNVARLASVLPDSIENHFLIPSDSTEAVRTLFPSEFIHVGAYNSRGNPLAIARAIRVEGADRFQLIHAHGTRAATGTMLARYLGVKASILYTVRGYHGLYNPGCFGLRIYLESLLSQYFDMVIFVSEADRAIGEVRRLKYRQTRLIPNGINLGEITSNLRDIDVIFVGRLVYQKNPEAFIESVAILGPMSTVHLVGDGELEEQVEALIEAKALRVTRHGQLSHHDTIALMARARVLVMTSRWEGLPTTAIEAPLAGAAVVGFDIPSLREVLGETANESLVPGRDTAALGEKIAKLLKGQFAERLGELQKKRMAQEYNPRLMADRYEDAYITLAGQV